MTKKDKSKVLCYPQAATIKVIAIPAPNSIFSIPSVGKLQYKRYRAVKTIVEVHSSKQRNKKKNS